VDVVEGDNRQNKMMTEMVTVFSSFLISIEQNVPNDDVNLGKNGTLYEAYVDFVKELIQTVCPMGLPCPEESDGDATTEAPDGNPHRSRELLSRKLCHDFGQVRRMLCGPNINIRRLTDSADGGIFQDANLYEIRDTECPESDHGKAI
jgi:hypothetical protein